MSDLIQVNSDGSLSNDEDPPFPDFLTQTDIIKSAFDAEGWTIIEYIGYDSDRLHFVEVEKAGAKDHFLIFIPSRMSHSKPRKENEKRIQLYEASQKDRLKFIEDFGEERCALLGLYVYEDTVLFAAWDPVHLKRGATNLWLNTDLLSKGARTKFARGKNKYGEVLCAFVPSMLPSYLMDMNLIHLDEISTDLIDEPVDIEDASSLERNEIPDEIARNRIFYGAPGTGKSHNLNEELSQFFPDESLFQRTTFYPEYTSGTFMGSFRPTPIYRSTDGDFLQADKTSPAGNFEPLIDYRFVPGPFLELLSRALSDPDHNYCLVIEEINRANASAVFADAFQMLDRDDEGRGKYSVTLSPEASDYLASTGHQGPVRIPANMFIWATMNSADQGVMPLDSAFKRRWTMEYVGLDDGEDVTADWELELSFLAAPIKWNAFRKAINGHLAKEGITEDRLLGPFFMTEKDLARSAAFENKLLQYLRDDVVKSAPRKLFSGGSTTFGMLVKSYRDNENIFVDAIDFGEG